MTIKVTRRQVTAGFGLGLLGGLAALKLPALFREEEREFPLTENYSREQTDFLERCVEGVVQSKLDYYFSGHKDIGAHFDRARMHLGSLEKACKKHRVPLYVAKAVLLVENSGEKDAISSAGARGVMQLLPKNAERCGYSWEEMSIPEKCIDAGVRVLGREYYGTYTPNDKGEFKGFRDWGLSMLAYNMGPGIVYEGVHCAKLHASGVQKFLARALNDSFIRNNLVPSWKRNGQIDHEEIAQGHGGPVRFIDLFMHPNIIYSSKRGIDSMPEEARRYVFSALASYKLFSYVEQSGLPVREAFEELRGSMDTEPSIKEG